MSYHKILNVSDCLRLHDGKVCVFGTITSMSKIYKMVQAIVSECINCGDKQIKTLEFPINFFTIDDKKCKTCGENVKKLPKHINALNIELQDSNTFNDTEKLSCILFDENTRNVLVGERVILEGNIQVCKINKKFYTVLYTTKIEYDKKKVKELSELDIEAVERFTKLKGSKILDSLVDMFAKNVIGLDIVKKGLIISSASIVSPLINDFTKTISNYNDHDIHDYPNSERNRINVLIVGDPGIGKSKLIKGSIKLVSNGRYESTQHSSAKSLTAIVSKENEDLVLRLGPIPLSRGSMCALNEIGGMTNEDQAYLLDIMEEGEFTINKYGFNSKIRSDTVIVATANPIGSRWSSNSSGIDNNSHDDDENTRIDINKIPLTKPLLDRFDLVFAIKDFIDKEQIQKYVEEKLGQNTKRIPDYYSYLEKHIKYASMFRPVLNDEAKYIINQYYVNLASSGLSSHFGSKRTLDTLVRIATSISKLKLKKVVDIKDAKEALDFFNEVSFQYMSTIVSVPRDPRDTCINVFIEILKKSSFPYSLEELAKAACEMDENVKSYLTSGNQKLKLDINKKLRRVYEILIENSNIRLVKTKPSVLKYNSLNQDHLSDLYDLYDHNSSISKNSKNNNQSTNNTTIRASSSLDNTDNIRSDEVDNVNSLEEKKNKFGCAYCSNTYELKNELIKHSINKHPRRQVFPS